MAPRRLGALAFAALGGLLEVAAAFHFPEDTLALHFLLQGAEGLVDVVVADVNLHGGLNLLRLSVDLFKPQTKATITVHLRAQNHHLASPLNGLSITQGSH